MPSRHSRVRDAYGSVVSGVYWDPPIVTPAPGKEWSYTFEADFYQLALVYWRFTASAQVAERIASFVVKDGDGNKRARVRGALNVEAGKVGELSGALNALTMPAFLDAKLGAFGLPLMWLPGGWSVGSETFGIQAEDQIDRVRLLAVRALDDYPGEAAGVLDEPALTWDQLGAFAHATSH